MNIHVLPSEEVVPWGIYWYVVLLIEDKGMTHAERALKAPSSVATAPFENVCDLKKAHDK